MSAKLTMSGNVHLDRLVSESGPARRPDPGAMRINEGSYLRTWSGLRTGTSYPEAGPIRYAIAFTAFCWDSSGRGHRVTEGGPNYRGAKVRGEKTSQYREWLVTCVFPEAANFLDGRRWARQNPIVCSSR